ncbi:sodium/calcium exchanger 2-like [Gigantopelta aegis]|uniref:sodium/calcium exchanger 2-like n=1 Tax=Gigantopelta aegis TaxID=1735272 RepID=UPI001B88CE79|nr:sodium/calcium exchanger 2-like [Gigantopelta aegis]
MSCLFDCVRILGRIPNLPEEEAAKIAAKSLIGKASHSPGWYRIHAIRSMIGGRKLIPQVNPSYSKIYENIEGSKEGKPSTAKDKGLDAIRPVIEFSASVVEVVEDEGMVRVGIHRSGKRDVAVQVRVQTINGTALAGEDYKAFNEIIKFAPNQILRHVFITITDDFEWEPDEFFFVKLTTEPGVDVTIGGISVCQITIINDDEPGIIKFAKPNLIVQESLLVVHIPVQRINGSRGAVSVKWKTKDITAIDGGDYIGEEGELRFNNQETSRDIIIKLFENSKSERDECFQIDLLATTGGAQLGRPMKAIITIVNDDEYNGLVSRILNMTKANLDYLQLEDCTYVSQFRNAMNVNGGDLQNATFLDYILHFATFFWKIMCAFVPPPRYLGGWAAFVVWLALIGFLTALIGDLAGLFGCLIGLEDSITAITLVALGTSMPDLFASKKAAVMEKSADSSVGIINGSNCVNVFLGLGLSWVIAAVYWNAIEGKDFEVPPGSLGFSVVLYTLAAVIALFLLVLRRFLGVFGKGELSGAVIPKYLCATLFILLWVLYILFSSLEAMKIIKVQIG